MVSYVGLSGLAQDATTSRVRSLGAVGFSPSAQLVARLKWPHQGRGAACASILVLLVAAVDRRQQSFRRQRQRCQGEDREQHDAQPEPNAADVGREIWNLLDLEPGSDKDAIRKSYYRFVRTEHPDVTGEASDRWTERFTALTTSYKQIMKASEDRFWSHSMEAKFDTMAQRKMENTIIWGVERAEKRAALREEQDLKVAMALAEELRGRLRQLGSEEAKAFLQATRQALVKEAEEEKEEPGPLVEPSPRRKREETLYHVFGTVIISFMTLVTLVVIYFEILPWILNVILGE